MANFLAIATVTATLGRVLQAAIGAAVPGAMVTAVRPDGTASGTPNVGVNIFLYQAMSNPAFANMDLPTRGTDGNLVHRPQAALNLHYLFTFYGDDSQLEPQRLLGSTVNALHGRPHLTRQSITDTINEALTSDPSHFLSNSDLAEEVDLVKFQPLSLNLEELSKLWSVFFQTPYTLSVAYEASVVLIEGEQSPRSGLPVRKRNVYVLTLRQPVITDVSSADGANSPLVAGSTLVIRGQRLKADETRVFIGDVEAIPTDENLTDSQVRIPLTSTFAGDNNLRAGVLPVQVVHPNMMGTPETEHRGFESNVAAFVFRPTITNDVTPVSGTAPGIFDLTLNLNPSVGDGQRLRLLLNEIDSTTPQAYSIGVRSPTSETASVTFTVHDIPAGTYLMRIQVDGAESVLEIEEDTDSPDYGRYIGPAVTLS